MVRNIVPDDRSGNTETSSRSVAVLSTAKSPRSAERRPRLGQRDSPSVCRVAICHSAGQRTGASGVQLTLTAATQLLHFF